MLETARGGEVERADTNDRDRRRRETGNSVTESVVDCFDSGRAGWTIKCEVSR